MRISDWSSDVCSSDLQLLATRLGQVDRIPRNTGRPGHAAVLGIAGNEVERAGGVGTDADFLLQKVELVAVVRTAEAAEQDIARLVVELVAEADARLPSPHERLALRSRGAEIVAVVIGVDQHGKG